MTGDQQYFQISTTIAVSRMCWILSSTSNLLTEVGHPPPMRMTRSKKLSSTSWGTLCIVTDLTRETYSQDLISSHQSVATVSHSTSASHQVTKQNKQTLPEENETAILPIEKKARLNIEPPTRAFSNMMSLISKRVDVLIVSLIVASISPAS